MSSGKNGNGWRTKLRPLYRWEDDGKPGPQHLWKRIFVSMAMCFALILFFELFPELLPTPNQTNNTSPR